jgi:hypothetical protein
MIIIILYNGLRVSFPWEKRPGRGIDHPPTSSVKVKERVELYFYSPSGSLWPVLGWIIVVVVVVVVHINHHKVLKTSFAPVKFYSTNGHTQPYRSCSRHIFCKLVVTNAVTVRNFEASCLRQV